MNERSLNVVDHIEIIDQTPELKSLQYLLLLSIILSIAHKKASLEKVHKAGK